jgi:hypothetical protein
VLGPNRWSDSSCRLNFDLENFVCFYITWRHLHHSTFEPKCTIFFTFYLRHFATKFYSFP